MIISLNEFIRITVGWIYCLTMRKCKSAVRPVILQTQKWRSRYERRSVMGKTELYDYCASCGRRIEIGKNEIVYEAELESGDITFCNKCVRIIRIDDFTE